MMQITEEVVATAGLDGDEAAARVLERHEVYGVVRDLIVHGYQPLAERVAEYWRDDE